MFCRTIKTCICLYQSTDARILNISFQIFANLIEPSICWRPCCYPLRYNVTGRRKRAKECYRSKKENKQTRKETRQLSGTSNLPASNTEFHQYSVWQQNQVPCNVNHIRCNPRQLSAPLTAKQSRYSNPGGERYSVPQRELRCKPAPQFAAH